jgi:nitrite reductase/ring-hydroxylating ferredoxin subunit
MNKNISRRDFLKLTGLTGGTYILTACSGSAKEGELSFVDRLMGRPLTDLPQLESAWIKEGDTLMLDLSKLPELDSLGGAVRIEGEALQDPILVFMGGDGSYYAFKNVCTHAGRMIDPVAGTLTLECCSASRSTYDYHGNVISGPAKEPLTNFPLENQDEQLIIDLN